MAYITVDDLLDYINVETGGAPAAPGAEQTALYQTLVDEAQAEIERVTGRVFEATGSQARTFGPESVSGDYLRIDDALTVTAVVNGDGVTVAATTGYIKRPRNTTPYYALLRVDGDWSATEAAPVTVTGTWGYSATAPADIKRLAKRLAYFYFQKRTQTGERQIFGGDTVQDASDYPEDIRVALVRFSRKQWPGVL